MGSVQPPTAAASRPGVLTKSIIRTPVVKFILHARIRHQDLNDVVFVGEDFVHIKQVIHQGHLQHIATKDNFGARILTAKPFSLDHDAAECEIDFIKTEQSGGESRNALPPQLVVLTLDSDDLVFLYLKSQDDGSFTFVHQTLPMPQFDLPIHRTGFHLAVDPASRALAVAASEKEIIIYSAKPTDRVRRELELGHPDWCPVSSQRPLSVSGVIQHLEFLHPPDNDPDHIILLLILVDQRRTRALRMEWYGTTDLRHAQVHPPQPMESLADASNLLIPLRDAAFLMITGSEMRLHRNILSGSMTSMQLDPEVSETKSPGSSSRRPIWASWCRPLRNKSKKHGQDIVYLVREDGIVILVEITSMDTIHSSHAGDMRCHVGTAFASLGDPSDPDILAVVGEMSAGRVVHMGHWASSGQIAHMNRIDTMEMRDSENLPNWASSNDIVVSKLPQSQSRSARIRDSIIVTSGREPYGTVTELRKGLEARVATYFDIEALKGMTDAWVLPNVSTSSILLLFSTPISTRIIDFDPALEEPTELDEHETTVMALDQRTLVAGNFDNRNLVQISERCISTSANIYANFEDRSRWEAGDGKSIIAAALEPRLNCAVVVRRGHGISELLAFKHHTQTTEEEPDDAVEGLQQLSAPLKLPEQPLCLATTPYGDRIIGVFATVEGSLELFTLDTTASSPLSRIESKQIVEDKQSLCDNMVLLHPTSADTNASQELLAICGLRDGSVVSVEIRATAEALEFGQSHSTRFGYETVRLFQQANETQRAYAFSGLDTCVLTWDGATPQSLDIQNLWVSDRQRPQLAQGVVTTMSMMPSSDYLSREGTVSSLADCLAIFSSNELLFAAVDNDPTVVPRQITVTGTPTRMIYAEHHRHLVCASVCTGVRSFPSDIPRGPPQERRQVWPVIEFIPADKDSVSFTFDLQPGERVHALLEWPFQRNGKTYSFILVGGSRQSGSKEKGRIAMLQASNNRHWEVENLKEARTTNFDQPVYALALYDEMTYVACVGSSILLSRFDADERKWMNICAPLELAHRSTSLSVSGTLIHASTSGEGLITLRLDNLPSRDIDGTYSYRLTVVAQPSRSDRPLSHTIVPLPDSNLALALALVSTSNRTLLGLTSPTQDVLTRHRTQLLFEATLPRSLSRLKQGSTRPLWRPAPPPGVLTSDLIGLSTDGSTTGIAILDEPLWRRLFWLQRVLEWDEHFSPHAPEIPTYGVDVEGLGSYNSRARAVPIGFAEGSKDEVPLFAANGVNEAVDRHVDGDVLARVLEPSGAERLVAALRDLAEREDVVGGWLGKNLEREVEAVEGVMEEVKGLVGLWL
jgi:hypothetical protein